MAELVAVVDNSLTRSTPSSLMSVFTSVRARARAPSPTPAPAPAATSQHPSLPVRTPLPTAAAAAAAALPETQRADNSIASQAQRLQTSLSQTIQSLDQFVRYHNSVRLSSPALDAVAQELTNLQTTAATLLARAPPFDDGATPCPANVLQGVRSIPSNCIDFLEELEHILANPENRGGEGHQWVVNVATIAGCLAHPLETGRRSMQLAIEGLDMATSLDHAERNGDSPPYATATIAQTILALKTRVAADRDTGANPLQGLVLTEFLEALQAYANAQSGNVVPPEASTDSLRAPGHPASNSPSPAGSDRASSPSFFPNRAIPTPAYAPVDVPRGPQRINLRHVSRLPSLEAEPLDVVFDPTASLPTTGGIRALVSTFFYRVRLHVVLGSHPNRPSPSLALGINGTHMVVCPTGSLLALVTEQREDNAAMYERTVEHIATRKRELAHDATAFENPMMIVYDYNKLTRMFIPLHWQGIRPFAFSPCSRWLAVRGVRNRVEVLEARTGQGVAMIRSHTDEVVDARFTPDSSGLVTMSRDGSLRVFNTDTWQTRAKLELPEWRDPNFLAVGATSSVIASAWGRCMYLWNSDTGALDSWSLEGSPPPPGRPIEAGQEGWPLAASPDMRYLCCRTEPGADVRELATGRVLCRVGMGAGFATAASFSPDSKYLALARGVGGHHTQTTGGRVDFWEVIE